MNKIEREAIILNSAWGMIDDMVNWAMFVKPNNARPTNLMFKTRQHSRLFIILLGDFLSQIRAFKSEPVPFGLKEAPSNARPSDLTFIFHLRQVCEDPRLGEDATKLSECIEAFADWLEDDDSVSGVNLPDIDVVTDLRVERFRYIKICGDIAKHNLARLSTNVRHLRKLLKTAGHAVSEQDAYLAIDNFFEWFAEDIFIYHSSQIAEFLNNIRWAIFEYLQPEYRRSWYLTDNATPDLAIYGYHIPDEITETVARAMYWDVMNRVRAKPYIKPFVISDAFKQRY